MYLVFALVAIPVLVLLFAWVGVTVYRLCFADAQVVVRRHLAFIEEAEPATAASVVPVGVREIREGHRRSLLLQTNIRYNYAWGISHGIPDAWIDDVWHRRN